MAKVVVQFDAITIRPVKFDEEKGQIIDIIYKLNGEEVYTVSENVLGDGLDVNMKVEFEVNPPPKQTTMVSKGAN